MEIRRLTAEDIPQAVRLARYVYDNCMKSAYQDPELFQFFDEYMDETMLIDQVENEKLFMWGSFDIYTSNGKLFLTSVGAMRSDGLITMLYVLPPYQRRGIGKKLLRTMRFFASAELGLPKIVVNAVNKTAAAFFRSNGFREIQEGAFMAKNYSQTDSGESAFQEEAEPIVSMAMKTLYIKEYPKRKIPTGVMVGISVALSLFVLAFGIGYSILF